MQIVIPFGNGSLNRDQNEKIAINTLMLVKDKTGYCGWVEDENGNVIRGTC
jgi:hypothetical protein